MCLIIQQQPHNLTAAQLWEHYMTFLQNRNQQRAFTKQCQTPTERATDPKPLTQFQTSAILPPYYKRRANDPKP